MNSEAEMRNQDPESVFLVTGASRGIGLQIVKELHARSKVSEKFVVHFRDGRTRDTTSTYLLFMI